MEFVKDGLIFVKKRTLERKDKKTLVFVTLADPVTFESEDFILNDESQSNFEQGAQVNVLLNVENRFSNVVLRPV